MGLAKEVVDPARAVQESAPEIPPANTAPEVVTAPVLEVPTATPYSGTFFRAGDEPTSPIRFQDGEMFTFPTNPFTTTDINLAGKLFGVARPYQIRCIA